MKSLSRVRLLATAWTAAHQAPPSMGFSRQEYWSGVPLPSPFTHYKDCLNLWTNYEVLLINSLKLFAFWFSKCVHSYYHNKSGFLCVFFLIDGREDFPKYNVYCIFKQVSFLVDDSLLRVIMDTV